MSTATKIVKFLKPWKGYNKGEVAGFDAAVAETLTGAKVAEDHDPTGGEKKPAPQRKPEGGGKRPTGGKAGGTDSAPTSDPQNPGTGGDPDANGGGAGDGAGDGGQGGSPAEGGPGDNERP